MNYTIAFCIVGKYITFLVLLVLDSLLGVLHVVLLLLGDFLGFLLVL